MQKSKKLKNWKKQWIFSFIYVMITMSEYDKYKVYRKLGVLKNEIKN